MSLAVALLAVLFVGLPLWYTWRVAALSESSRAGWPTAVAEAAAVVALALLLGRWDIAGVWTRWLLLALFAAAVARSWWHHRHLRGGSRPRTLRLLPTLLLFAALGYVVFGTLPPARPIELAFPLRDGRFMVGQGGGNQLLNHHAGHPAQRYAADITALGRTGFRARAPLPADPSRYAIWGASVISPCVGRVTAARDGLPDLAPPRADPEHPAGNHVILDCDGVTVELAHLMQGSVAVGAGDTLAPGDPVGRVGNSGNTTEPHLHVHAVDPATGQACRWHSTAEARSGTASTAADHVLTAPSPPQRPGAGTGPPRSGPGAAGRGRRS